MSHLSKIDQIEADCVLARFIRGEIRLMDIPSWMLIGKRCRHNNMHGRCINGVMTSDPYCFYHMRFNLGFSHVQREKA